MISANGFDASAVARLVYAADRDRRQRERRTRDLAVRDERRDGERRLGERRIVLARDAASRHDGRR